MTMLQDREGPAIPPSEDSPFQRFESLMPYRVQDILLVASRYDSFILEKDGQLGALMLSEFLDLNLRHTPNLTQVSSGAEAVARARRESRFNLIITTLNPGDMEAPQLAREVKQAGLSVPVVLLAYDAQELQQLLVHHPDHGLDRIFLWQGNARILLAIVKYIEDRNNAWHDTQMAGVQVIVVVEDNIRYYSSFLPMIYGEVITQAHGLISEGLNLTHKILRMRARPKILLCTSLTEAWETITRYGRYLLGVISDVEYPCDQGPQLCELAGLELAQRVRERFPEVPFLLQSSRPELAAPAHAVGASFLVKGSRTLLTDLRRFMVEQFAFGDFVFRLPDRTEVDRAADLKSLEEKLRTVPAASIAYHAERNHFSNWFAARTEFTLAHMLRPRKVTDYRDIEELRHDLIRIIALYRREQGQTLIGEFDRETFDAASSFARIGGGSLGGKARGLAFMRLLLDSSRLATRFPGVLIRVPPTVVLGTDVFDEFLESADLLDFALHCEDDEAIRHRFLDAPFPPERRLDLTCFLDKIRYPLAVRSSSLLEDSQYQPFTGVYTTYMLPNNHPDPGVRLQQLERAIKGVYASTFLSHAKAYLRATPYRLEEEKMAVILQQVVGQAHRTHFYPDLSGVARSHNSYPSPPMKADDGIAAVALGLGRTVVGGEKCLSFCPRYPRHVPSFSSIREILAHSQREFWALALDEEIVDEQTSRAELLLGREIRLSLEAAEAEGSLSALGSTYSAENQAIYDGIARDGIRLVSFAGVLKHQLFPLPEILNELLALGRKGMNRPVEIEFAARLFTQPGAPREFGFLQLRPMALAREGDDLAIEAAAADRLICSSPRVLGHGKLDRIFDIVVVDPQRFERSRSQEAAREVARLNAQLSADQRPYLLIGVGRWGSADPWLGIPVTWDQISGARAIVEAGFQDFRVEPSQGSHFFQNLSSFQVGYFTVNADTGEGFIDWAWLDSQPALTTGSFTRHLRFDRPVVVQMNGRRNQGVIHKA